PARPGDHGAAGRLPGGGDARPQAAGRRPRAEAARDVGSRPREGRADDRVFRARGLDGRGSLAGARSVAAGSGVPRPWGAPGDRSAARSPFREALARRGATARSGSSAVTPFVEALRSRTLLLDD